MELDLTVNIGNLKLQNPIMAASGTFGYGLELAEFCPPEALGAIITKGISLEPWVGNKSPRVFESGGGLLNAIGLENIGLKAFLEKIEPLKKRKAVVGANILGRTEEEYAKIARELAKTNIDFIEVNISCPNVAAGGLAFGALAEMAAKITDKVVNVVKNKPIIVKLSPLDSDIVAIALSVEKAGATAVSLINTIPALAINLEERKPQLANVIGGLSGQAVKPVALRQVWLCAKALKIPVIGLGGIFTAEDALEFIVAGATAVQIGTATLQDPRAPITILENMKKWLKKHNIKNISQMRGVLKT